MNLLICGISGRMGKLIDELAQRQEIWEEVYGIDVHQRQIPKDKKFDVTVDFSHPSSLDDLLTICINGNIPLVIGTTGYTGGQMDQIQEASLKIPILVSSNMSLGMNLLFALAEEVASIMKNKVDIEVIEAHHNRKKDAPSGSAKSIVEALERGIGEIKKHQYGRIGECPRVKGEIGIHAIRGGNIVGFHEVQFINDLEIIKISHEAQNPSVFAQGALEAARFILNQQPGLYTMKNVLKL